MPSIFARARTTSTKNALKPTFDGPDRQLADEFGRVPSRTAPPPTPSKGDRRANDDKRVRAQSTTDRRRANTAASAYSTAGGDASFDGDPIQLEDGYLPTQVVAPPLHAQLPYGYLSHESHVILGVEDVSRLVEVVAEELGARGEYLSVLLPTSRSLLLSFDRITLHVWKGLTRLVPPGDF